MRIPLNEITCFINNICRTYKIDESHGIKHALDVYGFARNLVYSEAKSSPYLLDQESVIYTAALLHDTCDKKYMKESEGIENINKFLTDSGEYKKEETDIILQIIQTMSYSKVKEFGFPELGQYQQAYHIVRESDLLAAYDIDRCILFTMNNYNVNYETAFYMAKDLYHKRMEKHIEDGLISTTYGKMKAGELLKENLLNIEQIESVIKKK